MFARCRFPVHQLQFRHPVIAVAICGAAWLLSGTPLFAQSGMCASGGATSTGSSVITGSTGGTTTGGTTSLTRTGAAGAAANAINLLNMARQMQQMQAQAEQAQVLYMMQALYLEGEMLRLEQQQIEEERLTRLARAEKRRTQQAARSQQRKNGKPSPRRETPTSRMRVSVAFQDN
jgi:hypothetical protein